MRSHLKYNLIIVTWLIFIITASYAQKGSFIGRPKNLPFQLKKIILVEPSANHLIPKEESNDFLSIKNVLDVAGI